MLVGMLYSLYGKQYFHNVTPLLTKAALKGFFFFFPSLLLRARMAKMIQQIHARNINCNYTFAYYIFAFIYTHY